MTQHKDTAKSPVKERLNKLSHSRIVRFAALFVCSYALLLTLMSVRLIKNLYYLELFPHELVLPLIMHAFSALLISTVMYITPQLKSFFAKFVAATLLSLYVGLYEDKLVSLAQPLKGIVPGMANNDGLIYASLIFLVLLVVLCIKLGSIAERAIIKKSAQTANDLRKGMYIFWAFIVLIPVCTVALKLPLIMKQSGTQTNALGQPTKQAAGDKPDIYYIVLDRYTNNEVLKSQFNFDNSAFIKQLREQGYTVRDNAYSNYQGTTMSISSTLNAQYTKDAVQPFVQNKTQARTLYHNLVWNAETIRALQARGYTYHALGSEYGVTYRAPLADEDYNYQTKLTFFGKERKLTGIEATEFKTSPYYRLAADIGAPWWPFKLSQRDHKEDVRNQINKLNELASSKEQGGRFIFAHILVPHDPYNFLADGSLSTNTGSDNEGMPIKEKYVNQIQFMNAQMETLLAKIRKNSNGKAVVVLNADEGPYPQYLNGTFLKPAQGNVVKQDLTLWPKEDLQMKTGILQAVHIPEARNEDLANLNSVNVFRIILNRYAGYNLDYLPDCHFVTNETTDLVYRYKDVTQKITGFDNPTCKNYESQP